MPLKEELSVWRCLFGAVCLELSVRSCLFGAACLDVSVCLFGGRRKLKMRQATKRVQNTYATFADRSVFGSGTAPTLRFPNLYLKVFHPFRAFRAVCWSRGGR